MTDDNGDSPSGKNLTNDKLQQRRDELEALYRRAMEIGREVGVSPEVSEKVIVAELAASVQIATISSPAVMTLLNAFWTNITPVPPAYVC